MHQIYEEGLAKRLRIIITQSISLFSEVFNAVQKTAIVYGEEDIWRISHRVQKLLML